MRLKREMSTINELYLSIRHVPLKRLSARGDEDGIVLAPDGKDGRLVLLKVFLEIGIEGFVRLVVFEDVELIGKTAKVRSSIHLSDTVIRRLT
jgi:hypothetical protein